MPLIAGKRDVIGLQVILYGLTGFVTGWIAFIQVAAGVWGRPTTIFDTIAIVSSAALLMGAAASILSSRVGAVVGFCGSFGQAVVIAVVVLFNFSGLLEAGILLIIFGCLVLPGFIVATVWISLRAWHYESPKR